MQICEVMTREVETVTPDASLQQAAMAMEAMGVGSLPVCAGRRLVGTLTDRDIVVRGVATGRSPVDMQVRECMTEDISWAFEEEDAEEVLHRMQTLQVRRLAVLDKEKNLITRDIVAIDRRLSDRVTVRLSEAAAQARIDAAKDKPKKKGGNA